MKLHKWDDVRKRRFTKEQIAKTDAAVKRASRLRWYYNGLGAWLYKNNDVSGAVVAHVQKVDRCTWSVKVHGEHLGSHDTERGAKLAVRAELRRRG